MIPEYKGKAFQLRPIYWAVFCVRAYCSLISEVDISVSLEMLIQVEQIVSISFV